MHLFASEHDFFGRSKLLVRALVKIFISARTVPCRPVPYKAFAHIGAYAGKYADMSASARL